MALPKLEYDILNDSRLLDDINNAFVKKFKTDKNFYIYDVNTNEFCIVNDVIWDLFPDEEEDYKPNLPSIITKYGHSIVIDTLKEIKKSVNDYKIFSSHRPKIKIPLKGEELVYLYKNNRNRLTLCITEDCNMRCKYCVYSGIYKHRRNHSKNYMTWDTARKAIDDFLKHSTNAKEKYIGFYGGEPLLDFGLIKKCVQYSRTYNNEIIFHIASNGLLLNDNIIKYIQQNQIYLTISLNGPKEIHNLYRVDKSNRGTYDRIIRNIGYIKERYPDFYNSPYFLFNCVFTPPWNLKKVLEFFEGNFLKGHYKFQNVSVKDTDYFNNRFNYDELSAEYSRQVEDIDNHIIKGLASGDISNLNYAALLSDEYSFLVNRNKGRLSDKFLAGGICYIGHKSILVTPEGNYQPCEKVSDDYYIGNVNDGFKMEKALSLIKNVQRLLSHNCHNCWALRLCNRCIISSSYIDDIENAINNGYCINTRNYLNYRIQKYLEILEVNPKAFESLKRNDSERKGVIV